MNDQHTLVIEAKDRPELLERLLRITRHRGFTLKSLDMFHQEGQPGMVNITLTVTSARPVDNLYHQLDKLWDVSRIRLLPQEQQQCVK